MIDHSRKSVCRRSREKPVRIDRNQGDLHAGLEPYGQKDILVRQNVTLRPGCILEVV